MSGIRSIKYNSNVNKKSELQTISFIAGNNAPSGTNRLNAQAYLYATRVYNAVYNDYAECFDCEFKDRYEILKNRIVEIKNKNVRIATDCSTNIIGVVSDTYGYLLNGSEDDIIQGRKVPVAMAGTVWVISDYSVEERNISQFLTISKNGKGKPIENSMIDIYVGKIVGRIIDIDKESNRYKILVMMK